VAIVRRADGETIENAIFRMTAIFTLSRSILAHAPLILSMAVQQVRRRYVGTVGGIGWSVLQPLAIIATYWFVFSVGFKVQIGDGSVSFIVYFITGMAAWYLLSEAIGASVVSISGNAHLIKKVIFPSESLPVIQVIATLVVHAGLLIVVLAIVLLQRGALPWTALLLPYYTAAAVIFCLGIAWTISALQVFFRDIQKLVEVTLGIWFWLTPIVWSEEMLGPRWAWIFDLNPAYYIVKGYRDCLIYGVPFWSDPVAAVAFWAICGLLLVFGAWVFKRLKPEFVEVL
jgi:ABC-type polysaccharide/polyol phosphate export permease